MKNPESLNQERELPQDVEIAGKKEDAKSGVEEAEEAGIEQEIKEVQVELKEGVGELNEHLDELEELQSNESLPGKAKNVLMAGIKEIKNYVQANPMVNILAEIQIAGGIGLGIRDLAEGKYIKEVASSLLSQVVFWGIVKAVAYLGWGRKTQQKEMARAERDNETEEAIPVEDGEVVEAQSVEKI